MTRLKQKAVKSAKKQPKKKIRGRPFKKGQSGNPAGKPLGTLSFKTIFEKAIKRIAKEKNLKKCDIETDLVIKAIAEARGGSYNYYRDIFDRLYGRPVQKIQGDEESPLFPDKIEISFKEK